MGEISREEYLKALDIVNAYYEQIKNRVNYIGGGGKTVNSFCTWLLKGINNNKRDGHPRPDVTRVLNCLRAAPEGFPIYINDINSSDLHRLRYMGRKSIEVFFKLRDLFNEIKTQ